MSLTGHIQDGQVVLDSPASLPNGTAVNVESVPTSSLVINPITGKPFPSYIPREEAEKLMAFFSQPVPEGTPGLYERLKPTIDAAAKLDLPTDGALNVDHYLYGHPKKS